MVVFGELIFGKCVSGALGAIGRRVRTERRSDRAWEVRGSRKIAESAVGLKCVSVSTDLLPASLPVFFESADYQVEENKDPYAGTEVTRPGRGSPDSSAQQAGRAMKEADGQLILPPANPAVPPLGRLFLREKVGK